MNFCWFYLFNRKSVELYWFLCSNYDAIYNYSRIVKNMTHNKLLKRNS